MVSPSSAGAALAPLPETTGILASASSVSRRAASALPPARAISPAAMPCSSSSRALSTCAGAIR